MSEASPPEPLLTLEEVSEWLGIPAKTIYDWRMHGEGPPALKMGRHLRWRRKDVDAWLEGLAGK